MFVLVVGAPGPCSNPWFVFVKWMCLSFRCPFTAHAASSAHTDAQPFPFFNCTILCPAGLLCGVVRIAGLVRSAQCRQTESAEPSRTGPTLCDLQQTMTVLHVAIHCVHLLNV